MFALTHILPLPDFDFGKTLTVSWLVFPTVSFTFVLFYHTRAHF